MPPNNPSVIEQDNIQGHWQRDWLRAPGFEDDTTRVHWMQAGHLYADVRVPLTRPDLSGATCLADLPTAALAELAQAEGFAGTTSVADSVCTWVRDINWLGATDTVDAGHLSYDADGRLIEAGVHADYTELWSRQATGPTQAGVYQAGDMRAYLVSVGPAFVFGLGTPDIASHLPTIDALKAEQVAAEAAALFSGLHMLGRWDGSEGYATLATDPFLESRVVLRRDQADLILTQRDFYGNSQEMRLTPRT